MDSTTLSKRRTILVIIGLMLAILLASLDSTIVSTAMPKIIENLNGFNYYTWPVIAYMLCITISMPLSGKLADIYGAKPVYIAGIVIFLVGSVLCGLSQSMMQLIVFRGLQGIGGAILISNTLTIAGLLFSPTDRAKYGGIISSVSAIAGIFGPLLGGSITDHFSWRGVFFVNVPIGLIALAIVIFVLPKVKLAREKTKIDIWGAALLIFGLVPLLLAFTWGRTTYAWNSFQIIGLFVLSAVMLACFALVERKAADPIMPLSLYRNVTFNFSAALMLLLNAVLIGASIFIPLFVQGVQGASASRSGIITTPMMLSSTLAMVLSGIIVSKTCKYKIQTIIGFAIMGVGTILLFLLGIGSSTSTAIVAMIVLGVGMGTVLPILSVIVQFAFPESQMGVATAGTQFFRFVGSTIASSILGTVLSTSMNTGLNNLNTGNLPSSVTELFRNNPNIMSNADAIGKIKAQLPQELLPDFNNLLDQTKQALSSSLHNVFVVFLIIAVIAMIISFFMKEIPIIKGTRQSGVIKPQK